MNDLKYTYDFINRGVCLGDTIDFINNGVSHKEFIVDYNSETGMIDSKLEHEKLEHKIKAKRTRLYYKFTLGSSNKRKFKDVSCLDQLFSPFLYKTFDFKFLFKHYLDREEFDKFLTFNYNNQHQIPLLNTLNNTDCIEIIASYIGEGERL